MDLFIYTGTEMGAQKKLDKGVDPTSEGYQEYEILDRWG